MGAGLAEKQVTSDPLQVGKNGYRRRRSFPLFLGIFSKGCLLIARLQEWDEEAESRGACKPLSGETRGRSSQMKGSGSTVKARLTTGICSALG